MTGSGSRTNVRVWLQFPDWQNYSVLCWHGNSSFLDSHMRETHSYTLTYTHTHIDSGKGEPAAISRRESNSALCPVGEANPV